MNRSEPLSPGFQRQVIVGITTACVFMTSVVAQAENCSDPRYFPGAWASEDQPSARVWLHREVNTNVQESVQFFTVDGPSGESPTMIEAARSGGLLVRGAREGVHYVATRGTAVFPPGETSASIDIPLIDNGLLDGFKDFLVVVANPANGEWNAKLVRIQDNELHSAVDPLFIPDRHFAYDLLHDPIVMPDGRLLLSDLTMLQTNGSVDIGFATNVLATFSNARLRALRALPDGHIFAEVSGPGDIRTRLVRFLPNGVPDTLFDFPWFRELVAIQPDGGVLALSDIPHTRIRHFHADGSPGPTPAYPISNFAGVAAELPDGSVLIFRRGPDRLSRLRIDGSPDPGFEPILFGRDSGFGQVAVQPDRKVVVNGVPDPGFKRFNPDGSPDGGFAPHPARVFEFLLTKDGRFLVNDGTDLLQLNEDGSLHLKFEMQAVGDWPRARALWGRKYSLPDGGLLISPSQLDFQNSIARWNADGSFDRIITSGLTAASMCGPGDLQVVVDKGQIIIASSTFHRVDGISVSGLGRLLPKPPERDFRVSKPSDISRSGQAVRLQVVRTGPTTNAASVSFRSIDDTAIAGVDYTSQRGTLEFAPLEVMKEIVVPLLPGNETNERVAFNLELADPSAGYSVIPITPVLILPQLRIGIESPLAIDGSVALRLDGTIPGVRYYIRSSGDFAIIDSSAEIVAVSPTTRLTVAMPRGPVRFIWATRQ